MEYSLLKMRITDANQLNETFIQAMCDWYIRETFVGDINIQPKCVYVKVEFITKFYNMYYPKINKDTKFILITGFSDKTIPNQVDPRWSRDDKQYSVIKTLLNQDNLVKWFAENCDELLPKMIGIPTGVFETPELKLYFNRQFNNQIRFDDNIRVLCCHRTRGWTHERNLVDKMEKTKWNEIVEYVPHIDKDVFLETLSSYTFTLCVNGGGLDPSPKAFEAIIAGSIPIIKYSSGIHSAYKDLPVVFVNEWEESEITPDKLKEWLREKRIFYEDTNLRRDTLYKLTAEYWKTNILSHLR